MPNCKNKDIRIGGKYLSIILKNRELQKTVGSSFARNG
jgi:hypothetical protein